MIESEFILGGFEAVLDGPAVSLDGNERLDGCSGRAPGREECEVAISDIVADQEPARPKPRAGLTIFGSIEISEFEVGPVVQPCSFRPFARLQALLSGRVKLLRDFVSTTSNSGFVSP